MICVSLANITFKQVIKQLSSFKMVELRLDLLNFSLKEYQQIINSVKNVIVTFRYGNANDTVRIKTLQELISLGANYVDIEIDADKYFVKTMTDFAKKNQCETILSYHNFKNTPQIEELYSLINKSKHLKADYIKIATMANTKKDVARVLSLYENSNNLIAFNMGEIGKISRIASLHLGAKFTYASISKDQETASGQLSYGELKELLTIFK